MSSYSMRTPFAARLCLGSALLLAGALPAMAQQPDADPVLATVNGQPIHLSEVKEAAQSLPQARNLRRNRFIRFCWIS